MKHVWIGCVLLTLAGAAQADEVEQAAQQVAAHYRAGDRAAAEQVEGVQPWDQAQGVEVRCSFASRPEGATLVVRRAGAEGALAVSFPPGTYGAMNPKTQERYGELYQDIMFLRAPVVVLREGQREARVTVPVACGTYRRQGPTPGVAYELRAVPRDTAIDRLLIEVCAGAQAPPERPTALAIWIAREGLSYDYLARRSFHSFATRRPVGVEFGPAARELLERSGVDADALRFYQEAPRRPERAPQEQEQEREQPAQPETGDLS